MGCAWVVSRLKWVQRCLWDFQWIFLLFGKFLDIHCSLRMPLVFVQSVSDFKFETFLLTKPSAIPISSKKYQMSQPRHSTTAPLRWLDKKNVRCRSELTFEIVCWKGKYYFMMISLNVKDSQHSTSHRQHNEKLFICYTNMPFGRLFCVLFSIRSDVWSPASVRNPLKWSWNYNEVNYTFFRLFLVQINRRNFSTRVDVLGHLMWHQKTAQDKERKGFVCAVVKLKQTFRRIIINFSSLVVLFGICFYTNQGLTGMFTLRETFYRLGGNPVRLELCFLWKFLIIKTLCKSKRSDVKWNDDELCLLQEWSVQGWQKDVHTEVLKKWLKMNF